MANCNKLRNGLDGIKNGKVVKNDGDEVKDKVALPSGKLPSKLFRNRLSVLTEMFENKHFLSAYHIIVTIFLVIWINSLLRDYLYNEEVRLGFNLISKGFKNAHIMTMGWLLLFFLSMVPYYGIRYWGNGGRILNHKWKLFWNRGWLVLYLLHFLGTLYCGTVIVFNGDMGLLAGITIMLEMFRLIMKVYSFGRVCISRVLNQPEKYSDQHPKISQYVYFLFAPTLLYRDNYPKIPGKIRWGYVAVCAIEFVIAIASLAIICENKIIRQWQYYGSKHIPAKDILMHFMSGVLYAVLSLTTAHYIVLHLWLNIFAEILRFADRLFYEDWWTCTNYKSYFRAWNIVMYDWLYTYIYKDFYEIVLPKQKLAGKLAVFFVSSFFHDYAVSVVAGYFLPVTLLCFFIGGSLVSSFKFSHNLIGNVFFFCTMGFGIGGMIQLHSLEYYSRVNCFKGNVTNLDFFIPKFIECYK